MLCQFNQSGLINRFASGDFIRTIAKVTYFDLSIYNGQLYATAWRSPAIHVYDCNTWKRLRTISTSCSKTMHFADWYFHRIFVNSTHILPSCCNTNNISIFDIDGQVKQSYGPNISITNRPEASILKCPYICQMNEDGALLVADEGNHRMLVLTSPGQWRRIQLSERLSHPCDAVWWRERLYVSTWGDSKITMFIWMICVYAMCCVIWIMLALKILIVRQHIS